MKMMIDTEVALKSLRRRLERVNERLAERLRVPEEERTQHGVYSIGYEQGKISEIERTIDLLMELE